MYTRTGKEGRFFESKTWTTIHIYVIYIYIMHVNLHDTVYIHRGTVCYRDSSPMPGKSKGYRKNDRGALLSFTSTSSFVLLVGVLESDAV